MDQVSTGSTLSEEGVPFGHRESELILLGTDYDNEGKPIVYLGKETAGELQFAGTAFLTLAGLARDELQQRIEKLTTERPPIAQQRIWRQPQWLKPELRVRVKHLQGAIH